MTCRRRCGASFRTTSTSGSVTFYEAVEAASNNLEQMGNVAFASLQGEGGEGVYISATGDNYDASRLVMLDLVRKMPVRGDYIAMVPNRDTLVLTGADDPGRPGSHVQSRGRLVSKAAADFDGRPAAGRRRMGIVAARSRIARLWQVHELRLRTVGMEYNDQKELLDQIHQQARRELFVASFQRGQAQRNRPRHQLQRLVRRCRDAAARNRRPGVAPPQDASGRKSKSSRPAASSAVPRSRRRADAADRHYPSATASNSFRRNSR